MTVVNVTQTEIDIHIYSLRRELPKFCLAGKGKATLSLPGHLHLVNHIQEPRKSSKTQKGQSQIPMDYSLGT